MNDFGIVGASKQIVQGNVKIVGKGNQGFIIGLVGLGLVAAYAVLLQA